MQEVAPPGKEAKEEMTRWMFLLVTVVVVGIFCLVARPPGPLPELTWLSGSWHSVANPSDRLVWSTPTAQGMTGVMVTDRGCQIMDIEPSLSGTIHLVKREFGPGLASPSARQISFLSEQDAERLKFQDNAEFSLIPSRTQAPELEVNLKGAKFRFVRD